MKTVLFASVDVRVSASDDGIVFAGRPTVGLIFIGIGALVWAALALGADTIDASLTGVLRGLAMFSVVSGIVIGLRSAMNRTTIDLRRGLVHRGGRVWPLSTLGTIEVGTIELGSQTSVHLRTAREGKTIHLVGGQLEHQRAALEHLRAEVERRIAASGVVRASIDSAPVVAPVRSAQARFLLALSLGGGGLWSAILYTVARDLRFTGHGQSVVVWPLGLWIMPAGLLVVARDRGWIGERTYRVVPPLWIVAYVFLFRD